MPEKIEQVFKDFDGRFGSIYRNNLHYAIDISGDIKQFISEKIKQAVRDYAIDIEHVINAYAPPEYSREWFQKTKHSRKAALEKFGIKEDSKS